MKIYASHIHKHTFNTYFISIVWDYGMMWALGLFHRLSWWLWLVSVWLPDWSVSMTLSQVQRCCYRDGSPHPPTPPGQTNGIWEGILNWSYNYPQLCKKTQPQANVFLFFYYIVGGQLKTACGLWLCFSTALWCTKRVVIRNCWLEMGRFYCLYLIPSFAWWRCQRIDSGSPWIVNYSIYCRVCEHFCY